jgi:16S rRNA (guanine527-N7)-methyltransferase
MLENLQALWAGAAGEALGPPLPPAAQQQLQAHWQMLLQWNRRINLTGTTDPAEAAWAHYADSLMARPLLDGSPIVDFGSGAGFPGMVLAIACPAYAFTLVEPRRKRASFLQAAALRLGLRNVTVREGRIEDVPDRPYAHAVTRALFSDDADLAQAQPWLSTGGTLLAFRAADAPQASGSGPQRAHTYTLGGRHRRIDVWTFPGCR